MPHPQFCLRRLGLTDCSIRKEYEVEARARASLSLSLSLSLSAIMEAGRRLISQPPSIHPPKTHATISTSFSVPVIHDQAAPAVASMPNVAIRCSFPASVLMQEQIGDFRSSHIIRDGKAQLVNSEATLDGWIESDEVFNGDGRSSQYDQCIKDFESQVLYRSGFWYLLPSSLKQDPLLFPSLLDNIRTDMDELLDFESNEAYNRSNLLSQRAVLASQSATSVAKESNYFPAKPDVSHLQSLFPTELDVDVRVENKPVVKSRRLMQRKLKKRKVSEKLKDVTTKVSSFRATYREERVNYDDFHLNGPFISPISSPETKQILTGKEEHDLFIQIQELMKLEKVKCRLHSQFGREPTLAEWAKALGMSCRDLRSYICSGNSSREKLIMANFRFVFHVAKQYRGQGLNLQDLLQEGIIGLMKGLERFEPQAGCRFYSYAVLWIRQSIRRAIFCKSRTIRLTEHVYALLAKIKNAKKACIREGYHPTNEELAKRVGITAEKFQMIMSYIRRPVSMQRYVCFGQDFTFQDVTADPMVDTPAHTVGKQLMRQHIRNLLSILTPRERQVICLRYGIHGGQEKTLLEIGTIFGLTKERIRQVEYQALSKLKQIQGLEAYTNLLI